MRYEELEDFTPMANDTYTVRFDRIRSFLEEFSAEYGLEMNPDFQRGHVWNEEQQVAYMEYVVRGGKSGMDVYFNCANLNGKADVEPGMEPMYCVDGLQRITAVERFVNNEITVFGHYANEFEGKPHMFKFSVHINSLKTRREMLKWYLEMNTGGVPHSKEEIARVQGLLDNA